MKLRVIDKRVTPSSHNKIQIVFDDDQSSIQFEVNLHESPFTSNFLKDLQWYFSSYVFSDTVSQGDKGITEKLIRFGQYLGDELLGEDHQLIRIASKIKSAGYAYVMVFIESPHPDFFAEPWETLVLPESKYVLSGAAFSFIRRCGSDFRAMDWVELDYDLSVPAIDSSLSAALHLPETPSEAEARPLKILYCLAPSTNYHSSHIFKLKSDFFLSHSAIDIEVIYNPGFESLQARLADVSNPIHVFHFDGMVDRTDAGTGFVLGTDEHFEYVEADKFLRLLVAAKIPMLCVDPCSYADPHGDRLSVCIADIAKMAFDRGLGNLVALSYETNSWIRSECFKSLYENLIVGYSLNQACVETRKQLLKNYETRLATISPALFQYWPLLVHYGGQPLKFFSQPVIAESPAHSKHLSIIQKKLFGFRTEFLPPLLNSIDDSLLWSIVSSLTTREYSCIQLTGCEGAGKSHLLHMLAVNGAISNDFDVGFYYSFLDHPYTIEEMQAMLGSAIGNGPNHSALEILLGNRCLFVFDDMDELVRDEQLLRQTFFREIQEQGHSLIFVSRQLSPLYEGIQKVVALPMLNDHQTKVHATAIASGSTIEPVIADEWNLLLSSLYGNPWLVQKIVPVLKLHSASSVIHQLHAEKKFYQESPVAAFYTRQWELLDEGCKRLLLLSVETPGILFEMLSLAVDQSSEAPFIQAFVHNLGLGDRKFSELISHAEIAGFLRAMPHGHLIDSRALRFLNGIKPTAEHLEESGAQALQFSRVVCEGVRILSIRLVRQPNQSIVNNLLLNRRSWAKHFERLWFGGDYLLFIGAKRAFDALLAQSDLLHDSQAWTLDLLTRVKLPIDDNADDLHFVKSWFMLAADSCGATGAMNTWQFEKVENYWRNSWDERSNNFDANNKQVNLLGLYVGQFLVAFYLQQQRWSDLLQVGAHLAVLYRQYQLWRELAFLLNVQARASRILGDFGKAKDFEEYLMVNFPYSETPAGFKRDILLGMLRQQADHQDYQLTSEVIEMLKSEQLDSAASDFIRNLEVRIQTLPLDTISVKNTVH